MRMRPWLRAAVVALAAMAGYACGDLVDPVNPDAPPSTAVRGMRLDVSTLSLTVGRARQITATLLDARGDAVPPRTGQLVRFRSTDASIASVTDAGVVSAVGAGTTVVRAEFGALVVGVAVTVVPRGVDRLQIVSGTAQSARTRAALPDPLVVRAIGADNEPAVGLEVTFAPSAGSADPATVATDAQGIARATWTLGTTVGAQSLVARATGFTSVTFEATAVARPIASLLVTPANPALTDVGLTVQMTARVLDDAGDEVPGAAVTWASSREDVAIVSATGLVTSVGAGQATITASTGSVSGSTVVTVTVPAAPPRLLLDPTSLSATATQTASSTPRVIGTVSVREASGRPVVDLGTLGVGTIDYTANQPTGWITATTFGGVAGNELSVTVDPRNLPVGTVTASIPVTSPLASNSPQTVAVSLTITAPVVPQIVVAPTRWDASRVAGSVDAATQVIAITNGAGGTLEGLAAAVSYGSGQATGWLTATLNQTTAPATLALSASAATLAAGTYDATVRLTSTVAGVAAVDVPVRLEVTAASGLRVFFRGFVNNPAVFNQEVVPNAFQPQTEGLPTIGNGMTYGFDFGAIFVATNAAQGRITGVSISDLQYGGAPLANPSWADVVSNDTGFTINARNPAPPLLPNDYWVRFTVRAPGFAPMRLHYSLGVRPRLVLTSSATDTTALLTNVDIQFDGDESVSFDRFWVRRWGAPCTTERYDISPVPNIFDQTPLPSWIVPEFLPTDRQFRIRFTPTQAPELRAFNQQLFVRVTDSGNDCGNDGAGRSTSFFFSYARPTYAIVAPDTTQLAAGRYGDGTRAFDGFIATVPVNLVSLLPQTNQCLGSPGAFEVLTDPADAARGLTPADVALFRDGQSTVVAPDTVRSELLIGVDTAGIQRGRTYVVKAVLRRAPEDPCPDGVLPRVDTLTAIMNLGGPIGTLRARIGQAPFEVTGADVRPVLIGLAPGPNGIPAAYPGNSVDVTLAYQAGTVIDEFALDIEYQSLETGWLTATHVPDSSNTELAGTLTVSVAGRGQLSRGEHRATVRARSIVSGQEVVLPVRFITGEQTDGSLRFGTIDVSRTAGCGVEGMPGDFGFTGSMLHCWGAVADRLLADGDPSAATLVATIGGPAGQRAVAPVVIGDSVFVAGTPGAGTARVRDVRMGGLSPNIVTLVEIDGGEPQVFAAGSFGVAGGDARTGFRAVLRDGQPFRATSIAVSDGTAACATSLTGNAFRRVYCWGNEDALGIPSTQEPRLIDIPTTDFVAGVTVNSGVACAWVANGNAWCWGANNDGQLGRGTTSLPNATPALVPGLTGVQDMTTNGRTVCATTTTGVFCWGSNAEGIIRGFPSGTGTRQLSPVQITAPVVDIELGFTHACGKQAGAIGDPSTLFCWGLETAPGGFVSAPGTARPVTTGYREAVWNVQAVAYRVGWSETGGTTCWADATPVWRCAGGEADARGVGSVFGPLVQPTPIAGQNGFDITLGNLRAVRAAPVLAPRRATAPRRPTLPPPPATWRAGERQTIARPGQPSMRVTGESSTARTASRVTRYE